MRYWRVAVAAATIAAMAGCNAEPAMTRQMRKERLVENIREKLLESVEAEKSAVLATTDEESTSMAQEAQHSAGAINQLRGELRSLVATDQRHVEIEKLDAFDAAWAEVERVDQRLLKLAVANTNLKAARLSASEGATYLDRFVDSLAQIGDNPDSSAAAIAALRIQPLLLVHIPTEEDAQMTQLEERIHALSAEVDAKLAALRDSGKASTEQLAAATQAWSDYQRVLKEALRLSRENSNVISFDVSVHEKRQVTKQCLAALSGLQEALDIGPKSVR